jgi:type IV secretory pathway VirB2 component (pilin)
MNRLSQKQFTTVLVVSIVVLCLVPTTGYCTVEGTLSAVQSKLIGTILPLAAILGLVFAGLSFVAGSPNARNHLYLAIMGAVVGFGAPSIIAFVRGLVQ